jgi:hypothetical protein
MIIHRNGIPISEFLDEAEVLRAIEAHVERTGEDVLHVYVPMPEIYIYGTRIIFADKAQCIETKGQTTRIFHEPRPETKLSLINNETEGNK